MTRRQYALISPCRDEAEFAARTLDSVIAQSQRPDTWVIVDDGSTDGTSEILARYAAEHEFIEVVTRVDRGGRKVGPGVIEAFYAGLETIDLERYEYLCKLDLDLVLPPTYFEGLIRRMEAEPRLGSCSGKAYFEGPGGQWISENIGDEVSIGASKFYRRACFEQIGGFVREVMWDGIDVHKSRQLGWKVRSWDDEELRFLHLRPMGSSQVSIHEGRRRHGRGQYYMGTSIPFILASALLRLPKHPALVLGSFWILWGYFGSTAQARTSPRRRAAAALHPAIPGPLPSHGQGQEPPLAWSR